MGEENDRAKLRIAPPDDAERRLADRTERVDAIVKNAFDAHLAGPFPNGISAIAVGGFGRRELFPCSDVDVLLLVSDELNSSSFKEPVGRFLQTLWDSGLRLSHSVHTVEECCQVYEHNVELSISLLDQRPLTGDAGLIADLAAALPRFYRLHGKSLARHLARLTRFRHAKFQGTIYHMEPNIKETPGSLRDLQVVRWFASLMNLEPATDLDHAWRFLAPIRIFLHENSKRDDNLLSFEMQDSISGQPAELMRNYYRHARSVFARAAAVVESAEESQPSLMRQFRDWRSRLSNSEFTVAKGQIFVRSPQLLTSDPGLVFRLFEFMARHGVPASSDALRRIGAAVSDLAETVEKRTLWPALKGILAQPKAALAIRAMHGCGLLGALLPEWARIDCMVVRDFYHRYTVDEHTIVAIEILENIADERFRELANEASDLALLRFALLMHDSGKGSGREHTAEAVRLVAELGARIRIPEDELVTINKLIELHLELSSAMSRDMEDPDAARLVADRTGTVEFLKMLALLTYADISAVNPAAMTPWRSDQLWRAYLMGYRELTRELDTERVHNFDDADPGTREFVEGLPNRYLRTHTIEEIHAHAALSEEGAEKGVALEIRRRGGYWRVVVVATDRQFLFAGIAGALASFGMNILKAEAFTNARGLIVDTFTFADPMRTLELNPPEVDRLRDTMIRVILRKQDVRRLLASRRHVPVTLTRSIEPRVAFNNEASQTATLIEIVAEDRPGLLYDLASAMSSAGCDIVVVLVDTEAHRALDVFYVTSGGRKLEPGSQDTLRTELLAACSGPVS